MTVHNIVLSVMVFILFCNLLFTKVTKVF